MTHVSHPKYFKVPLIMQVERHFVRYQSPKSMLLISDPIWYTMYAILLLICSDK